MKLELHLLIYLILKKVIDLGDDIKEYAIYQDIVDDNQLEIDL